MDLKLTTSDVDSSIQPLENQDLEDDNFDIYGNSKLPTSVGTSNDITPFYYISIRDIIKSLASRCVTHNKFNQNFERDILLIGCVNSIIIYDTLTQSKQINVNLSGPVELIAITVNSDLSNDRNNNSKIDDAGYEADDLTVCYGSQKLYTVRLASESDFSDKLDDELSNDDDDNGFIDNFAISLLQNGKSNTRSKKIQNSNQQRTLIGELTSQRSTGDRVTCLIQGIFDANSAKTVPDDSMDLASASINPASSFDQLVVTGNRESQIRLWPLDNFDQNLESCRVVIEESGPVSCLYPINTASFYTNPTNEIDDVAPSPLAAGGYSSEATKSTSKNRQSNANSRYRIQSPNLPLVKSNNFNSTLAMEQQKSNRINMQTNRESMNHFAFGLENNYIGVYRLYMNTIDESNIAQSQTQSFNRDTALDPLAYSTTMMAFLDGNMQPSQFATNANNTDSSESSRIQFERLWRLKSRHKPTQMIMYDLNGDGQDELLIGYQNGRLEARSPFTGQLLGATRSFKSNSDHLAGLTTISYSQASSERLILVALSTRGNLIAYKPRQFCPRQPLQAYIGTSQPLSVMVNKSSDVNENFDELSQLMIGQDQQSSMTTNTNLMTSILSGSEQAIKELDMQIETRQEDSRPKIAEPRQNLEHLHRLNSLQKQLIDLEAESGKLLMQRLDHEAKLLHQFDVTIDHRWDFDFNEVSSRKFLYYLMVGCFTNYGIIMCLIRNSLRSN